MTLDAGARLGPYEILAPLGAGGMGQVYRARDTRLDRQVAVKVLPESFAANEMLRARFEREAKVISSLNHPHICALYDVGLENGIHYLVLELIEGEPLEGRLKRGPLPAEQVLRYGAQLADALDRAHRSGIVHRDLKPGNIMIARSGVKLLDFGLARAAETAQPVAGLTAVPTQAKALTQEGTILGTFHYMAPEQLEGLEADPRTDIFALGAVLYEMATGRRAFEGKSKTSLIAAIVSGQPPPMSALQPLTPPALERVVGKCLQKDAEDRWHSAHDLAGELRWIAESGSQASASALPLAPRRRSRERLAWAVAAASLMAAAAFGLLWYAARSPVPQAEGVRFLIPPTDGDGRRATLRGVRVSREGRRLLYWTDREGILVREMDGFDARLLPGTENASSPFFSPDGEWIGFYADGKIKKVRVAGGDQIVICSANRESPGATWLPDGSIIFSKDWTAGLMRVHSGGGEPQELTTPDPQQGHTGHIWPESLPDGSGVFFTTFGGSGLRDSGSALLDLKTLRYENVVDGVGARYVASGHLVYYRAGFYYAAPFHLARRRITGPERVVLEGVRRLDPLGAREHLLSFSETGLMAYISGDAPAAAPYARLAWISRDGKVDPLPLEAHYVQPSMSAFSLSPDQTRLAVTLFSGGEQQVWIYDLERGTRQQLTREGQNFGATWHPDGRSLTYTALARGSFDIRQSPADGSGDAVSLLATERDESEWSWSPDGRWGVYSLGSHETSTDIWIKDMQSSEGGRPLVVTPLADEAAVISPDGRWLAYLSHDDLLVARFPGLQGRILVARGAQTPVWSPRALELFYVAGRVLYSVRFETAADALRPLKPEPLFEVPQVGRRRPFTVSSDGSRFLFAVPVPGRVPRDDVHVVTHGFEELLRPAAAR